jgi:thiol-disulfide isomerase/thioredoxin
MLMKVQTFVLSLLASVAFQFVSDAMAEDMKQDFIASGVTRKVGGYRPARAEMDQEESIVKVAPEGLSEPKYGLIKFDEKSWAFILDELEDGESKFYLDTNGDGDLTNDPEATWEGKRQGEFTTYNGEGQIDLGDERLGVINFYRFDPKDEGRKSLADTLLFYADYGFEYSFKLDDQEFSTFVAGMPTDETSLGIDRDKNEKLSSRFERVKVGVPFNFTGTTYRFEMKEGNLVLGKSAEEVEQLPLPPNLEIGKQALEFAATTMDGAELKFPSAYTGKIVMLDFWATWCGPCIGEIPNMKEAYADWHDAGFEILGISFDKADMEDKIREFLEEKELPWPQIYEGKLWDTELGRMHDVGGIPFVLLVDGDGGQILATARQLRGKGLSEFIGAQLKKKFGNLDDKGADAKDDENKEDVEKNDPSDSQ